MNYYLNIEPNQNHISATHGSFTSKSYFPKLFQNIRNKFFHISQEIWSNSFSRKSQNPIQKIQAEGQSGSIFFKTKNDRFFLKTISDGEFRLLMRLLPDYILHFFKNPSSLITRICGLFSILFEKKEFFIMVLETAFNPNLVINEKYDLKVVFWLFSKFLMMISSWKLIRDQQKEENYPAPILQLLET